MHSRTNFKVVLVGDAETGKSALLQRFTMDTFLKEYKQTIGVELGSKILGDAKLQIWCTAGQERFKAITCFCCRGGHAFILTYDISNRDSFENIKAWVDDIKRSSDADYDTYYYLVGTKSDLEDKQVPDLSEVKFMDHGIPEENCFEVSAKNNIGINELFDKVANDLAPKHKAKITFIAEDKATNKQHSPSFLQKHWRKIAVGLMSAATIAVLAAVFWPALVALPFLPLLGSAAGAIGISSGLFAGIGIGAIVAAAGFIAGGVSAAIGGNKNASASDIKSAKNGSINTMKGTLGVDPRQNPEPSEKTALLDGNSPSGSPLSLEGVDPTKNSEVTASIAGTYSRV